MKRIICVFLILFSILHFSFTVCAGEAMDIAANLILTDYYPTLSIENKNRITEIAKGDGSDNEKITLMCSFLDEYSGYAINETSNSFFKAEEQYSYSIGKKLYIKINLFAYGVDDAVISLIDENPNKQILLDLADCSGGLTSVMENIAYKLVPSGLIYSAKYKNSEQQYFSDNETTNKTIMVITNKNTASCAEILAVALQESGIGIIIGEKTFGKSSIQNVRVLPNGGTLKITVGHWFTRKGKDINLVGIIPDITIGNNCIYYFKKAWEVQK